MNDDAIQVDDRPNRVELPTAPCGHLRVEVGSDLRNQGRRYIHAIEFLHDLLYIPSGHALGIEGKNLLVKPAQPALVFGDEQRLEGGIAVARCRKSEFAEIALDSFC